MSTHQNGYPVRGVLSTYVAAPRERGGTHRRWVTAGGPFSSATCYSIRPEQFGMNPLALVVYLVGRGPQPVQDGLRQGEGYLPFVRESEIRASLV